MAEIPELTTAAALMREQQGPEHVRHLFWNTLADWLELASPECDCGLAADDPHCEHTAQVAVARAYLETAQRSARQMEGTAR